MAIKKRGNKDNFRDNLTLLEKSILGFGEQRDWHAIFNIANRLQHFAPTNEVVKAYLDAGWSFDEIKHYFAQWEAGAQFFFESLKQTIQDLEAGNGK